MALKQTEALAIWCLGEQDGLAFADLEERTGAERRRLWRAVQGLMRKRLVRPATPELVGDMAGEFQLTRRGRCVYDLLRTLESHSAAA